MKKHMIIEEWIIAVMICVMVLMVAGQVFSCYTFRYVFAGDFNNLD